MGGNSFVYTQLQRRRRPSNPPSPTSTRRYAGRLDNEPHTPLRGDAADGPTLHSDSPSLDVDLASPAFSIPEFSPVSSPQDVQSAGPAKGARFSDEYAQRKPRAIEEDQGRPTTSGAGTLPVASKYSARNPSSQFSGPYSSLSASRLVAGQTNENESPESAGRPPHQIPIYSFSTTSLASERFTPDDTPSGKSHAAKKSRLNLLNPMSLLARRRSSQAHNQYEDGSLSIGTLGVPAMPDDYDPRIRGNIVHDFSAPRTRRLYSSNDAASPANPPQSIQEQSPSVHQTSDLPALQDPVTSQISPSPKHSPVFKEHLEEDNQVLRPGQTAYLQSLAASSNIMNEDRIRDLPAFARRLPATIPDKPVLESGGIGNNSEQDPDSEKPEDLDQPHQVNIHLNTTESNTLTTSDKNHGSVQPVLDLPPASALPKHMTSTSSRFSFQLGGRDSAAQEKLLEDKHKLRMASMPIRDAVNEEEAEDDAYADYDFDEDDGLEEKIPGVNVDADDEDFDEITIQTAYTVETGLEGPPFLTIDTRAANEGKRNQEFESFHFTPQPNIISPASTRAASQPTPRDADGQIIGLADTKDSPGLNRAIPRRHQRTSSGYKSIAIKGLGIVSPESPPSDLALHSVKTPPDSSVAFNDEDLYFDDGNFGDNVGVDGNNDSFDEEIFDDENGMIRDIPAQNAIKFQLAQQRDKKLRIQTQEPGLKQYDIEGDLDDENGSYLIPGTAENASYQVLESEQYEPIPMRTLRRTQPTGLTEGNLAAYHAALASAADEAAINGRFSRSVSTSHASEDQGSQLEDSQPGLVSDESRISRNMEIPAIEEHDGFPHDDDLDDDLMIAEANAEALENDEEGFYGQEFGFYARAHGKSSAEFVNGGYFAPRGFNGVKRNHSAKGNFQEPSLTPITEKSEWSTRNSIASFQLPGMPGSAHTIPSPGLAQLLDYESGLDDEMSLSALMKLRRGAFGGSSTSVNSVGLGGSSSLPGSSPLAHFSGNSFPTTEMNHGIYNLTGSAGIPESEEEDLDEEEDNNSNLPRNTLGKKLSDASPSTPQDHSPFSPPSTTSDKGRRGHSRTSSGGESISYVRDRDGWLLERRRTGDDGEHELVGREYLAGARI